MCFVAEFFFLNCRRTFFLEFYYTLLKEVALSQKWNLFPFLQSFLHISRHFSTQYAIFSVGKNSRISQNFFPIPPTFFFSSANYLFPRSTSSISSACSSSWTSTTAWWWTPSWRESRSRLPGLLSSRRTCTAPAMREWLGASCTRSVRRHSNYWKF